MARLTDDVFVPDYVGMAQKMQEEEKAKLGTNPKDLLGVSKPSMTKIPPIAILEESLAMMDGAGKYGAYNWRENKVIASIYIDALLRHVFSWLEGEEFAEDSRCHHLGHARACLAILLDARATGNLIDDRPIREDSTAAFKEVMKRVTENIPAMKERHTAFHTAKDKKST